MHNGFQKTNNEAHQANVSRMIIPAIIPISTKPSPQIIHAIRLAGTIRVWTPMRIINTIRILLQIQPPHRLCTPNPSNPTNIKQIKNQKPDPIASQYPRRRQAMMTLHCPASNQGKTRSKSRGKNQHKPRSAQEISTKKKLGKIFLEEKGGFLILFFIFSFLSVQTRRKRD